MTITKSKQAFRLILSALLLTAIAISCNDSEPSKTDATSDTTVVAPSSVTPDTIKMDTATTRPVKNPD